MNIWAEGIERSAGQTDFREGFIILDHILTLRALIEEVRAHERESVVTLYMSGKPST